MRFVATKADIPALSVELNLAGVHNVQNALAAIAVGREAGVADAAIAKALSEFKGVGRRFQRFGEIALDRGGSFTLIDDYGHHPTEMAATLDAVRRSFPGRRLVLAFQPHRYTRLASLFDQFSTCFNDADTVIVAHVYPAGEAPIAGADRDSLVQGLRAHGHGPDPRQAL